MRPNLIVVVLLSSLGVANAEHLVRSGPDVEPVKAPAPGRSLSTGDVNAKVKPVYAEISRCYLDAAANIRGAGHLEVKLVIHRRGKLDAIDVSTPGLPAKVSKKIDTCVRSVVESLEFPARRTDTTAIVPYFFQLTDAPNAGPQLSCWNPRGCR